MSALKPWMIEKLRQQQKQQRQQQENVIQLPLPIPIYQAPKKQDEPKRGVIVIDL